MPANPASIIQSGFMYSKRQFGLIEAMAIFFCFLLKKVIFKVKIDVINLLAKTLQDLEVNFSLL
ncbi:MAG: hypothetical protein ACUZ8E_11700 [Candidatus Anammoxibacter sp.]